VASLPQGSSGKCSTLPQPARDGRSKAHPARSFDQRELARREAADMSGPSPPRGPFTTCLNSNCITGI
jgi:hypothetical protein